MDTGYKNNIKIYIYFYKIVGVLDIGICTKLFWDNYLPYKGLSIIIRYVLKIRRIKADEVVSSAPQMMNKRLY